MKLKIFLVIIAMAFLSACGEDKGNQYVGHWINEGNKHKTIDISRNGAGYIYGYRDYDIISHTDEYPAVYKDHALKVGSGMLGFSVVINDDTGELIVNKSKYKKGPLDPDLKHVKTISEKQVDEARKREKESLEHLRKLSPELAKKFAQ